ncbi:uncharacterized protein LOC105835492 isoform X3 [Monomorium pharaonis]|uniref:uncharacterized protein LOC105835492 isoform X3 n=1 Tax=Monomorium pharaonis TaxID=307658 RepID=UPI00102E1581|nr:uncharacterized protein LOC105835492 isoform X3 [Monomorium pharaonis]
MTPLRSNDRCKQGQWAVNGSQWAWGSILEFIRKRNCSSIYLSRLKCKKFWGFQATRTNLLIKHIHESSVSLDCSRPEIRLIVILVISCQLCELMTNGTEIQTEKEKKK